MNEVAGELLFELFEPTVKTRFVNTVLTCVAMEIRLLWCKTLAGQFSKGTLQCRRFHRAHANGFSPTLRVTISTLPNLPLS